jgi:hypothetical protein
MHHWSMIFPGNAARASEARQFTLKTLGGQPGGDTVQLVVSELAGNAIQHSNSGKADGHFTLHLSELADHWRICVDDAGSVNEPRLLRGRGPDARRSQWQSTVVTCLAPCSSRFGTASHWVLPPSHFWPAETGTASARLAPAGAIWRISPLPCIAGDPPVVFSTSAR